jgi:hypothetical protein
VPIRTARLTTAGSQPCAAAWLPGRARTSEGRGRGPAGDARAPPGTGTGGEIRTLKQPGLNRLGIPGSRHARAVRRQGLEPRIAGLRVQCFTRIARGAERHAGVGYGQPVDRPGFEPGNLLLARELLYQLELAAQGLPGLARRAATTGPAGTYVRSRIGLSCSLVFRCGFVNTQARSSRRMVQMKTARRACALRAASGWCLHLYPEATPVTRAALGCKHESMPTCLSPRPHHMPDHGFTVRFLSSLLFRVRAHADRAQRYFRPDSSRPPRRPGADAEAAGGPLWGSRRGLGCQRRAGHQTP